MDLPHLNSCCCGCSLKTGTIIIGAIDAVLSTALMIMAIINCVEIKDVNSGDLQDYKEYLYTIFIMSAIFSALYLTIAIMLVVGAAKSKPNFLKPWLIYVFIYIIIYIANATINAIVYLSIGYFVYVTSYIISTIIGIALQVYFFLVVYSLYRDLVQPTLNDTYPSPRSYPNFARDGNEYAPPPSYSQVVGNGA